MNKELPREEQLRIVLQNYDTISEKCGTLNEEIEKLKKQLDQKDVLYKNMVRTYEKKISSMNVTDSNSTKWEKKYNELSEKYKNCLAQNNEYVKVNKKLRSIFKQVAGFISDANHRISLFKLSMKKENISIDSEESFAPFVESLDNIPVEEAPIKVLLTRADFQANQFVKYVRTVWNSFNNTGSLRGISNVAREMGVTALTKEQFFHYGLNTDHLTDDYILNVYKQIKKR